MNVIENYRFGYIVINGSSFHSDVIIFPEQVQDHWWRSQGHQLILTDLQTIIDYQPDSLFIGTGMFGFLKVENTLINQLKDRGIHHIVVDKTKKVCQKYNDERNSKKVAALHLTC